MLCLMSLYLSQSYSLSLSTCSLCSLKSLLSLSTALSSVVLARMDPGGNGRAIIKHLIRDPSKTLPSGDM